MSRKNHPTKGRRPGKMARRRAERERVAKGPAEKNRGKRRRGEEPVGVSYIPHVE